MIVLESMHGVKGDHSHDWYTNELAPVLIYWTRNGRAYPFFTELIFSPGRSSTGRFYCDLYAGYDPATREDWEEWTEQLYREDGMLHAAATVARQNLIPDVGIWIRLPYPLISDRPFDPMQGYSLATDSHRFIALSEWIGQVMSRWEQQRISPRLSLRGFVWGREAIPLHDVALVQSCNEMLRELRLESIWLANYRSLHVADWKSLGFSSVAVYPNYTGATEYDVSWLQHTALYTALNHIGIQMICGQGRLYSAAHFYEYGKFLKQYIRNGGSGSVVYRFPNWSLAEIYEDNRRLYRSIYRSLPKLRGGGNG